MLRSRIRKIRKEAKSIERKTINLLSHKKINVWRHGNRGIIHYIPYKNCSFTSILCTLSTFLYLIDLRTYNFPHELVKITQCSADRAKWHR